MDSFFLNQFLLSDSPSDKWSYILAVILFVTDHLLLRECALSLSTKKGSGRAERRP